MDALIPKFVAALCATTFESAEKGSNMDAEGMARVKTKLGWAMCNEHGFSKDCVAIVP